MLERKRQQEIFFRGDTPSQKIRAAVSAGITAYRYGSGLKYALFGTGHEIRHALRDNKSGYVGVSLNGDGETDRMFYEFIGRRSPHERIKIAEAVGERGMSDVDVFARNKAQRQLARRELYVDLALTGLEFFLSTRNKNTPNS